MSVNLLNLVTGALGNGAAGKIAGILGESEDKTSSALGGALPALLGGLMNKASTGSGAAELHKELEDHDGGILDGLGDLLGGGGAAAQGLMGSGSGLISGLLGNKLGGIVDAVAGLSGLGSSSSKSLLGLLAPIVMGVLGKQVRSGGLDAGGLASLLSSQKEHIGGAMPAGFADKLGFGDILGSVTGAAGDAAGAVGGAVKGAAGAAGDLAGGAAGAVGNAAGAVGGAAGNAAGAVGNAAGNAAGAVGNAAGNAAGAVGNAAGSVGNAAGNAAGAAGDVAKSGGGLLMKLLPLALLALLAIFLLPKLCSGAKDVTSAAGDAAGNAAGAVGDAASGAAGAVGDAASGAAGAVGDAAGGLSIPTVEGFDTAQLNGVFTGATDALGGITDVDSAKAALPALEGVATQAGDLGGIFSNLPAAAQGPVIKMVSGFLPQITGIVSKLTAIPGVGPVIQPAIDGLMSKFALFK